MNGETKEKGGEQQQQQPAKKQRKSPPRTPPRPPSIGSSSRAQSQATSPNSPPPVDLFEVLKQLKKQQIAQLTPTTGTGVADEQQQQQQQQPTDAAAENQSKSSASSTPPLPPLQPELSSAAPFIKKSHHGHTVSWDPNSVGPEDIDSFDKKQYPVFRSSGSGDSKVTLDDLRQAHPMEGEAEKYIMQALEKTDPTHHVPHGHSTSGSSSSSNLVSNLSAEAVETLIQAAAAEAATATATATTKTANTTATAAEDAQIPAVLKSSLKSRTSFRSLRSGDVETGSSVRSSFRIQQQQKQHRRIPTMEMQLEALATAMDEAHANDWTGTGRIPTVVSTNGPTMTEEDDEDDDEMATTAGSAAAVQEHANLLFRRNADLLRKEAAAAPPHEYVFSRPDEEVAPEALTAAKRWNVLKQAVRGAEGEKSSYKKTDGDMESKDESEVLGSDPEQGNAGSCDNHAVKTRRLSDRMATAKLFRELEEFFSPRRNSIFLWIRVLAIYVIFPCLGIAAILFYLAGNPPTGILEHQGKMINGTFVNTNGQVVHSGDASASWWLLFVMRQALVGSLAKFTELFLIDFLAIRSGFISRFFGPWITLFLLQSKGWPFIMFMWGLYDFALLSGEKPFFAHWAYWQKYIDIFNEANPSGNVVDSEWNHKVLAIAVSVGAVVAAKRFWLGLYLGRQTFSQYSDKLASVMKKILLVSELASLGRDFERYHTMNAGGNARELPSLLGHNQNKFGTLFEDVEDESSMGGMTPISRMDTGDEDIHIDRIVDPNDRSPLTGMLSQAQKSRIDKLLGMWEEPTIKESSVEIISVKSLLQFRRALACLHTPFPFSGSFGLADTRMNTVESAQDMYYRLMLRTPAADHLSFEIIALLGVTRKGDLDQDKLKDLIRLFRPDRDGTISLLDFVKSIDIVYKELRLLRASVANSSKIDHAFENIFNFVFYAIVLTVILSQLGFDPLALFLSISGVVLAFAFMIGSASSTYFEGLLFILVRRPYQIGDGVHVSNPESETSYTGSAWWTVEDVTLFTTSVIFMFTGEKATLSNGSLANSRIINSSRSPQACLYIMVKFPVDVTYEKIQIFKQAVEEYMKNRPREWLQFVAFRTSRLEVDHGFIEYIVVGQHRAGWSDWGTLRTSNGDLMHFCFELQKKMNIKYHSPPMPIDLRMQGLGGNPAGGPPQASTAGSAINAPYLTDVAALQAQFAPKAEAKKD